MWVQEDGVHRLIPFGQGWKGEKMANYREQYHILNEGGYHPITFHTGLGEDGLGNCNTAA